MSTLNKLKINKILGKCISCSRLDEIFLDAEVYGPTTLSQILNGKHMKRGFEGHMILYLSLFGSLNRDRASIREFTMHLTIIFRYKVTYKHNTNISGTTSKKSLSHVKTKTDLTIYLAAKAFTNFKNVNGGYAVSYKIKCISNLEDFAQEMMTHDHGEADTLLLLHAADV